MEIVRHKDRKGGWRYGTLEGRREGRNPRIGIRFFAHPATIVWLPVKAEEAFIETVGDYPVPEAREHMAESKREDKRARKAKEALKRELGATIQQELTQ